MGVRRGALVALCLVALAACGTTVPQASRGPAGTAAGPVDGSLGVPGSGPSTAPDGGPTAPAEVGGVGAGPSADPAGGPAATASEPPRTTTTATTTAADRSPLTVGVTYIDNDQTSSALGVSDSTTASKQNVVRALVRGLNRGGGAGGRPLKTVEYEWNSQSNNWSADASAACARFTQDAHVSVVLDNAFGTIGGFRRCVEARGVLVLGNGPEGDRTSSAEPLHANTYNLTTDSAYVATLDGLSRSGYLVRSSHVGVVLEACPETQRAWDRSVAPRLHGLVTAAPVVGTVSCTRGFADAGAAASAVSNDVLQFRSKGVDRVMFVSDNESVLLLLFASSADSQGYRPGYLLTSGAQAQALRSQIPSGQQPQLHGVGQLPFGDTDGAPVLPADARCRDLARAGGVTVASYADYGVVMFECGPVLLLDAALRATRGAASATTLASAVAGLGTSFAGPGLVGSATAFGSARHDGPAQVRPFGFDRRCTCMRYSGAPRPAPQ